MKVVAIYSRKSKESDTGESIKNQIEMCKDYFLNQGKEFTFEIFQDEGFSGGNTKRPEFQRMMLLAKHGKFDIVACYKVDRIARNIIDFMNTFDILKKNKVSLVSVTEGFDPNTPIGMMLMTMIAGFAEMERMNIAQRVNDNMNALAKMGRWLGGTPPTGYRAIKENTHNGKYAMYLELIPEMKEKLTFIFESAAAGYTSRYIGKLVELHPKTIINIVYNPTYCPSDELSKSYLENLGYKVYGELNGRGYLPWNRRPIDVNGKKMYRSEDRFVTASKHEIPTDSATWIKANEEIRKRGDEGRPRISQYSFLAHMLTCKCGCGMSVDSGYKRKDGSRSYYFKCSSKKGGYNRNCDAKLIRVDYIENDILSLLQKICLNKELLNDEISKTETIVIDKNEIKNISQKIKSNDIEMENLVSQLGKLKGSAADAVTTKMNKLSEENDNLKQKLFLLEHDNILNSINHYDIDYLYNKIVNLMSSWENLSLEDKQFGIQSIIDKIKWDGEKFKISFIKKS